MIKYGVPGSLLKDRIEDVKVNCSSEEEAMALAAGAWFAGKKPLVYMQNSGLGRCLDIILSLYKPYEIPLPDLVLSIRYKPHHHSFVGNITRHILELVDYNNVEVVER